MSEWAERVAGDSRMRFWGPSKLELELDEAVRSVAKPATQFKGIPLRPGEPLSVTDTRFGGTPYAEAGDVWPTLGKRPYDFVAQLNLHQCDDPPTSAYDLIAVFICWHALATAEEDELKQACFVRSYRNPAEAKAVAIRRPEPIDEDDFQVTACATQSHRVLTYPRPGWQLEVPAIAAAARYHKGYQESFEKSWNSRGYRWRGSFNRVYEKSLKRLGFDSRDECTQIGGYPTWVHENAIVDDGTFFVAQIAYEPAANNCIGDAAPIFIAAHRSDPTRFETDPWQTH